MGVGEGGWASKEGSGGGGEESEWGNLVARKSVLIVCGWCFFLLFFSSLSYFIRVFCFTSCHLYRFAFLLLFAHFSSLIFLHLILIFYLYFPCLSFVFCNFPFPFPFLYPPWPFLFSTFFFFFLLPPPLSLAPLSQITVTATSQFTLLLKPH